MLPFLKAALVFIFFFFTLWAPHGAPAPAAEGRIRWGFESWRSKGIFLTWADMILLPNNSSGLCVSAEAPRPCVRERRWEYCKITQHYNASIVYFCVWMQQFCVFFCVIWMWWITCCYYCLPVCINEANPSISLVLYDQRLAGNAIMAAAHLGVSCGDLIGGLIPIAWT